MGFIADFFDFALGPLYDQPSKGGGSGNLLEQAYGSQQSPMMDQMYLAMLGQFESQMAMMQQQQQNQMMQNMAMIQGLTNQMQMPSLLDFPEIQSPAEIDFTETVDKLSSRARADQALTAARKKGVGSTIHTGSLLDEENATVTGSPLG